MTTREKTQKTKTRETQYVLCAYYMHNATQKEQHTRDAVNYYICGTHSKMEMEESWHKTNRHLKSAKRSSSLDPNTQRSLQVRIATLPLLPERLSLSRMPYTRYTETPLVETGNCLLLVNLSDREPFGAPPTWAIPVDNRQYLLRSFNSINQRCDICIVTQNFESQVYQ